MEQGCNHAPDIECIWADGRGRAWFCEPHFKTWSAETDAGLPRAIVKQRKVPDGEVGESYGDYPKTATASPVFLDYAEAMAWVEEQSKLHGGKQKFLTSDEYKKAYPLIKRLHQEAVASNAAARAKAMRAEGLSYGDRVSYSTFSLIGGVAHFEGVLVDRGGQPTVKLDRSHDGKRHVLWNRGWKKLARVTMTGVVERIAALHLAKATGVKTGVGEDVGLFIPLPKNLAKKFPSLGENDNSPSHVTFLYIGDFKNEKKQKQLIDILRDSCRRFWPNIEAKLSGLNYFDHEDKDRRVPHVQVEFNRDMAGFRHKVKQELLDAGIEVGDSWPEYKPHVTLAYMPGMDSEWEGRIPKGKWDFDSIEVWGLPEVHKIRFGPSLKKVSEAWLRAQVMAVRQGDDG